VEAIRNYVSYTEGIPIDCQTTASSDVSRYALGISETALWLFYYEREKITTLDMDFLASLKINALSKRPETYIIYADKCALDKAFLAKHGITFKRIPRDITKF
jgi:adenine-specific DNA-methyltransferase